MGRRRNKQSYCDYHPSCGITHPSVLPSTHHIAHAWTPTSSMLQPPDMPHHRTSDAASRTTHAQPASTLSRTSSSGCSVRSSNSSSQPQSSSTVNPPMCSRQETGPSPCEPYRQRKVAIAAECQGARTPDEPPPTWAAPRSRHSPHRASCPSYTPDAPVIAIYHHPSGRVKLCWECGRSSLLAEPLSCPRDDCSVTGR